MNDAEIINESAKNALLTVEEALSRKPKRAFKYRHLKEAVVLARADEREKLEAEITLSKVNNGLADGWRKQGRREGFLQALSEVELLSKKPISVPTNGANKFAIIDFFNKTMMLEKKDFEELKKKAIRERNE